MSKTKWYSKPIYLMVALALVLSLGIVAVPMAGTVEAQGPPNPTFVKVDVDVDGVKATSIEWNIGGPAVPGPHSVAHSIHVTTSGVSTADYAMVGVPTNFTLDGSTAISYWGYTVGGSGVTAPDEIFLFLDTADNEAVDVVLGCTSPLGTPGNWVQ